MSMSGSQRRIRRQDSEFPPYSRLFIVCEKSITEPILRESFSKFGTIEEINIPCDRNTGEPKGFAYIQFLKTSESARALEEMNIKILPGFKKPLKIMVAATRSEIQSDDYDEEKFKRLFINVSRSVTEDVLLKAFEIYGHIESIVIQKDRNGGEQKGFAYVKFRKFSEAADAIEKCDNKYRAVFATPKSHNKRRHETAFESNINNLASSSNVTASLISMMNSQPNGYTKVNFICCPFLTQKNVEMIFDIIPGLTHFQFFVDLIRNFGKGVATYSNPISAAYAVEKLGKLEYPPGVKLFVKPHNSYFEEHERIFNHMPDAVHNLRKAISSSDQSGSPDLAQLTSAIAEASKLIKTFTGAANEENPLSDNDLNYCSVKLPPPQPLADIDSPLAKRCFLVGKPKPPPITVLRDIFCRFGNLINVYALPGKTVGYARYANAESAEQAIATLHGAEVCGVRLKVLEADEETFPKRPRND